MTLLVKTHLVAQIISLIPLLVGIEFFDILIHLLRCNSTGLISVLISPLSKSRAAVVALHHVQTSCYFHPINIHVQFI